MASLNLILKPAQTELISKPGVTITQAYNVINNSNSSIVLSTEVLPFAPLGDDGSVTYDNLTPNPKIQFSLGNSDLVLGQTFVLHPQENRQIVLKIKSDSSMPLSDAYYTFFINQDQSNKYTSDGSGSTTTGRLGSHLLLSFAKSEDQTSTFTINKFNSSPHLIDVVFPAVEFHTSVLNTSKYYAKAMGKITITKNDLILKEMAIFPHNVLSGNSRSLVCLDNNLPIPCRFSPPFWPGSYTATLTLDPTLGGATTSTTFFVFPYTLVLILALLSLIFVFKKRTSIQR